VGRKWAVRGLRLAYFHADRTRHCLEANRDLAIEVAAFRGWAQTTGVRAHKVRNKA
jgi:hypothetical protein